MGTISAALSTLGTLVRPEDRPVGAELPQEAGERQQSLERLVRENHGWLSGWIRGRVGDRDLAHDISQDALLKALRSVSQLQDISKFPSWLYRIAQNTLRDHLRRKVSARKRVQFTTQLDEVTVPSDHERKVDEEEDVERLLEAIRALPAQFREPLLLRHSRDLSYEEIGAILGLRENAVQVRVLRARRLLRKSLRESDA
jgi:RNA polymerase sigma factor (sigma-70 family)